MMSTTIITSSEESFISWADMDQVLGPISWIWDQWLPVGFLTILAGESGIGKSNVLLYLAGCYTAGWNLPDGTQFPENPGKVLWCESEAAQAVNLDRAKKWGIPLDKMITPLGHPLDDVSLDDKSHRQAISQKTKHRDIVAILVDSLSGANSLDENSTAMLEKVRWLAQLARDYQKPIILSHHLRKKGLGDNDEVDLHRLRGSSAIVQPARVIWALDIPDASDRENIRLHVIKSNLARFPQPIGLNIDEQGVTFGDAPESPRNETATDQAINLLLDLLEKQPMRVAIIEEAAKSEGISFRTMKKAKKALGIVSIRIGGSNGHYEWSLPAKDSNQIPL